ncbi:MAG: TraR/DksA C4-type zinc finger protein [Patescibacteria group bacterium]
MLSKEKIQNYKEELEVERVKVGEGVLRASTPQNFGDDVDVDEETSEAEGFANSVAMIQSLKDRLSAIDEALESISAGTYGVCTGCGKEISEELLDVVPESRLCRECKKEDL